MNVFIGIDGKRLDGFVNFDYVRDRIKNSYAQLAWKEKRNNFRWDEVTRNNRTRIKNKMSANDLIKELKDILNHLKGNYV